MELSDEQKSNVKKQVNFYFSDSNLPFDAFLKGQVESAENGWVDLSVVVAFQRMQKLLQISCKGPDDIEDKHVEAVAAVMKDSDVVEISEDGFQIKRKNMPSSWDAIIAAVEARTVHAAPFPVSAELSDIATCFSKYGTVNQVRMQRWPSKAFKGVALIELATKEEADKLLQDGAEFQGAPLRLQTKTAYLKAVDEARKAKKDTGLVDVERPVITAEGLPEDPAGEDDGEEEQPPAAELKYELGCLIRYSFEGEPPASADLAAVKSALGGHELGVAYVRTAKDGGIVRCLTAEHAKQLLARVESEAGVAIDGAKVKATAVSGEEERAFHAEHQETRKRARDGNDGFNGGRRGGGRGRGGRGRGGFRGGRSNKRGRF